MSKNYLRKECLPSDAGCSLVQAMIKGHSIGHAIACRWRHDEHMDSWVSQLVVHGEYRSRGIATDLLRQLKEDRNDIHGIASSNPMACMAAARAFGSRYTLRISSLSGDSWL